MENKNVNRPTKGKKECERLQVSRMTFACLLMIVMQGGQDAINDFLRTKSPEAIKEYAEVWDECKDDPIGSIIQRPAFESLINNSKTK